MDEKSRLRRRRRRRRRCLTQYKNSELIDNLFELSMMRIEKRTQRPTHASYSSVADGSPSW